MQMKASPCAARSRITSPSYGGFESGSRCGQRPFSQTRSRVARVTLIAEDRYSLMLDAATRPESLIAELAASGAALVSVMPLKTTSAE